MRKCSSRRWYGDCLTNNRERKQGGARVQGGILLPSHTETARLREHFADETIIYGHCIGRCTCRTERIVGKRKSPLPSFMCASLFIEIKHDPQRMHGPSPDRIRRNARVCCHRPASLLGPSCNRGGVSLPAVPPEHHPAPCMSL